MLRHSLTENSSRSVYGAARKIRKGEKVLTDYTGMGRETKEVRNEMLRGWFASGCQCGRCLREA